MVGYGVQRRATITGSVATIKAEEVLEGRVAGVSVSNAEPGANNSIHIRGTNSASAAQPMVVVDGQVQNQGYLKSVSSSQIQSVAVLKDANATALYGSRAANGVVVVTTRNSQERSLADTAELIEDKRKGI